MLEYMSCCRGTRGKANHGT